MSTPTAGPWQANAWGGAFPQYFAPKAKEFRRASAGGQVVLAGPFDQPPPFDQAAKILFVQAHACQRFHNPLQLPQGEGRG